MLMDDTDVDHCNDTVNVGQMTWFLITVVTRS